MIKKVFKKTKLLIWYVAVCVLTAAIITTSVFAWFILQDNLIGTNINTGSFTGTLDLEMWDKTNKTWIKANLTNNNTAVVNPDFGEMQFVDQLPDDCNAYFRAKVNVETKPEDVTFGSFFSVDNVEIAVGKYNAATGKFEQFSETDVAHIDYYSENYRFLEIYEEVGGAVSDPSLLSFSSRKLIDTKDKQINDNSVADGDYIYLKLAPVPIVEGVNHGLQNLLKDIRVELMPYMIVMKVSISGEARTGF